MESWFLIGMIVAAIVFVYIQYGLSERMLRRWAAGQGYVIIVKQPTDLLKPDSGPFYRNVGRGQTVYRIVVEDRSGSIHTGWVRLGGDAFGILTFGAKVCWDDRPEDSTKRDLSRSPQ